eukprot:TRINITY_DN10554_c0_g4_i1.p1 TRINITY_DN10554_c0_g4~~TRINITY_DN10554_c0_g4_i1.p1  ORF type:complete len:335 (+),score=128.31 TRINITY_DN10554_c0_g4_i1:60-1007(+)
MERDSLLAGANFRRQEDTEDVFGWNLSEIVVVDRGGLFVFRLLVALYMIALVGWDFFTSTNATPGFWFIRMVSWSSTCALIYFVLSCLYSYPSEELRKPRSGPLSQVSAGEKVAVAAYVTAWSLSFVMLIVFWSTDYKAFDRLGLNTEEVARFVQINTVPFIVLLLDLISNKIVFRHGHLLIVCPVTLAFGLVSGLGQSYMDFTGSRQGLPSQVNLSLTSFILILFGVVCSFYLGYFLSSMKYSRRVAQLQQQQRSAQLFAEPAHNEEAAVAVTVADGPVDAPVPRPNPSVSEKRPIKRMTVPDTPLWEERSGAF